MSSTCPSPPRNSIGALLPVPLVSCCHIIDGVVAARERGPLEEITVSVGVEIQLMYLVLDGYLAEDHTFRGPTFQTRSGELIQMLRRFRDLLGADSSLMSTTPETVWRCPMSIR